MTHMHALPHRADAHSTIAGHVKPPAHINGTVAVALLQRQPVSFKLKIKRKEEDVLLVAMSG